MDEKSFDKEKIEKILENIAIMFMSKPEQRRYCIWMILNTAAVFTTAADFGLDVDWNELPDHTKKIADIMKQDLDYQSESTQINAILLKFLEEAYPDEKFTLEYVRKEKERALDICPILRFLSQLLHEEDLEDE